MRATASGRKLAAGNFDEYVRSRHSKVKIALRNPVLISLFESVFLIFLRCVLAEKLQYWADICGITGSMSASGPISGPPLFAFAF
jgi:hypothetical protein